MKSPKYIFLFSLFFLSFLTMSVQNVLGSDPRTNLFASNLQFELDTGSDEIKVEHEKRLDDMVALGSSDAGDGFRLYHSRFYFTVSVNVYSTYAYRDVFDYDAIFPTATWLTLHTGAVSMDTTTIYNMEYNAYRLNSFTGYGIEGVLNVDASFVSLNPDILQLGSGEFSTSTSDFYSNIVEKRVISTEYTAIGDYDTYYQGDNEVELTAMDMNKDAEPDGEHGVADHINQLNLGAERGAIITPTYQQGEIYLQQGVITNDRIGCTLRPDVKVSHESLVIRYQDLWVDTSTGPLGFSPAGIKEGLTGPVVEKTFDRIIGWEVKNYNIHFELSLEVDLYSLTEFNYIADSDATLDNVPVYMLEDVYFNNLFYGDTGGSILVDTSDPVSTWLNAFWGNYKWLIIIAIIIAVVVVVGPVILPMLQPLLMNMGKGGSGNGKKVQRM